MIKQKASLLEQTHPMIDLEKWQRVVDLIVKLFEAPRSSITQHLGDEFQVISTSNNEENFDKVGASFPYELHSYCRNIIESNSPLYVKNALNSEPWKDSPPAKANILSYLGYPLFWPDGRLFGTICVSDSKGSNYSQVLQEVFEHFRDLINADLAMVHQYDQVQQLSLVDEMTGCSNRRGLMTLGPQCLSLAERFKYDVGVMFIDIDNLKQVNDVYGHDFGDRAITILADILQQSFRETDVIARMGGDEFFTLVLLRDDECLKKLKRRLIYKYREYLADDHKFELVDISVGSRTYSYNQLPSLEEMLIQTDLLMYKHKQYKKK